MCSFKLEMHQNPFSWLRPRPRWGGLRRSLDHLVGWGGGHPSPSPLPRYLWRLHFAAFGASLLDAFAVSSAPLFTPDIDTPRFVNSGSAPVKKTGH